MDGRAISEERITVDGIGTLLRRSPGDGVPTLFCHGNPTSSADWLPFMGRLRGPALALDMPCFGAAERVGVDRFAADLDSYASWIGAAIDELGLGRLRLVVHDWGSVALIAAQRRPATIERLVVVNAVPLLPGYRWHWLGRAWRTRGLGEVLNAINTRAITALLLRQARPRFRPMPKAFVDGIAGAWDRGMSDAVLRLYRSADAQRLAEAGSGLGELRCPAMVAWGLEDRFLGAELAVPYTARLPEATLLEVPGAGHWPWLDRPELIEAVCRFLDGGEVPASPLADLR
jgi:pimeloyl-ACP methyl ester carboxylesterase